MRMDDSYGTQIDIVITESVHEIDVQCGHMPACRGICSMHDKHPTDAIVCVCVCRHV